MVLDKASAVIDFRFHLISIVGVFLALGIGILMGSLALGDNLVNQLKRDVQAVRETNSDLQEQVTELDRQLDGFRDFADEVQDPLTGAVLRGERVVLFVFEGTDGELVDGVRDALEAADSEVASTILLTEKLVLDGEAERDQLALVLRSASDDAVALRNEAATQLAARASVAAAPDALTAEPGPGDDDDPRLRSLLDDLSDAGFVSVDADDEESPVPEGAMFLVLGGHADPLAYEPSRVAVTLGQGLAERDAPVMVAETSDSVWGMVAAVRSDGLTRDIVATVDQGETVPGRIATVLGLDLAEEGTVEHYGVGSGAARVIPEIAPL